MLKSESIIFLFKREIQEIFDSFTACFNIRTNFFSPDVQELKVGLHKPVCAYCALIQNRLELRELCIQSDKARCREAAEKRELILYTCHAGLLEAIHPVFFENAVLGHVVIGQFRNIDRLNPHILQICKKKGLDIQDISNAYFTVPLFSNVQIRNILSLFKVLVKHIASQQMISRKGDLLLNKIIEYLGENVNSRVTLSDLSKVVNKSNSYLSHLFNRHFNKGFSRVFIEMKLNKADDYFRIMPDISVSEVAYKLGYEDPLYFSRLYKKYRGCSPKAFKNKIR